MLWPGIAVLPIRSPHKADFIMINQSLIWFINHACKYYFQFGIFYLVATLSLAKSLSVGTRVAIKKANKKKITSEIEYVEYVGQLSRSPVIHSDIDGKQ